MREVERRARTADKVKIVNASVVPMTDGKPEYKNGDILEIIEDVPHVRYAEGFAGDGKYRVLNTCEYVVLENEFTLSDLKPCMVVRQRRGDLKIVSESKDGLVLVSAGWTEFSGYTDDLLFIGKNDAIHSLDIVEVYDFSIYNHKANEISTVGRELLWKREEPKPRRKMTVAEICKELGEEIEIVKGE